MAAFLDLVGDLIVPKIAKVILEGSSPDSNAVDTPCLNVFHFHRLTGSDLPTATEWHTAMGDMITALLAALTTDYTLNRMTVRYLDDPLNAESEFVIDSPGIRSGDRLPLYNSVCVQLKSGVRGRNFKGSKHISCISEDDTTGDILNADGQTIWLAAVNGFIGVGGGSTVGSSTWAQCILSASLSDLLARPAIFTGADVESVLLNDTLGTMKRRKEKTVTGLVPPP